MVDYNEKVLQIKKYLTDVFNDVMQQELKKSYIRLFKPGADKLVTGESIIIGKFYYLEPLQKIYFYYSFDQNIKWALADDAKIYYEAILNYAYTEARSDINCTMCILGPTYLIDNKNLMMVKGANITRLITPYTFGYWEGVNKHYEFLNDPAVAIKNKYDYDMDHNIISSYGVRPYLDELEALRQRINKSYDCFYHPRLIPEAFNEYKTGYKEIMGIDLPLYDIPSDSTEIKLLNASDFFNYKEHF